MIVQLFCQFEIIPIQLQSLTPSLPSLHNGLDISADVLVLQKN